MRRSIAQRMRSAAGVAWLGAALSLSLVGCSSGSVPGSDTGPGPAGGTSVRGVALITFVTDSGEAERPVDLREKSIAALVPDATGRFKAYPGAGGSDGRFEIPGVPQGSYYLKVGTQYVVTSHRELDLGIHQSGRPDGKKAESVTTRLSFDIGGLHPWSSADTLQFFSSNVGAVAYALEQTAVSAPTVGDTALSGMVVDYARSNHPMLVEQDKSDRAILTQLTGEVDADGVIFERVRKAFWADPFTLREGEVSGVGGTFVDVPADLAVERHFSAPEFRLHRLDVHPDSVTVAHWAGVAAQAGGKEHGGFSDVLADLLVVDAPLYAENVDLTPFRFGNPFPEHWGSFLWAAAAFEMAYAIPRTQPLREFGLIYQEQDLDAPMQGSIVPMISPPRDLKVDNWDGRVGRGGISRTPTLSWLPPQAGEPTGYVVALKRIIAARGFSTADTVATFYTTEAQLKIPPDVLVAYEFYYFRVRAVYNPGVDFSRSPNRLRFPRAFADALSGMFQPFDN